MKTMPRIPGEAWVEARAARAGTGVSPDAGGGPIIGVLAVQGDVLEHVRMLAEAGAQPRLVRRSEDLEGLQGILVPGGESTTIGKLARAYELVEPIRERARGGMPVLGTCAGMIVMAERVLDGEPLLGLMDVTVRRNAYGRQVDSFEADVGVQGIDHPVRGVFIRAPWVEEVGAGVEVLAGCRGGNT